MGMLRFQEKFDATSMGHFYQPKLQVEGKKKKKKPYNFCGIFKIGTILSHLDCTSAPCSQLSYNICVTIPSNF
jgi:hypothetical protein